ncbi:MAG: hypothetical protein MZV63_15965 [Marinilabiliales bacterium]|nr:hypothetical protein [Marinilabiliales bacterium]
MGVMTPRRQRAQQHRELPVRRARWSASSSSRRCRCRSWPSSAAATPPAAGPSRWRSSAG